MDDLLLRELMNGMWFVLSVEVIFALTVYVINRALTPQEPDKSIFVVSVPWYRELGVQLAIAWLTYMSGSALRAGWIWALLECQNREGIDQCGHISKNVELLYAACFLAIVGGVCTIRILLPQHWRPWSYVIPAALALAIPTTLAVVH